jgi:hypothetical protein
MVARLCVEEAMTAAVMDGVEVEDGVGQKFGSWLLFYTGDGAVQTSYMFRVAPPPIVSYLDWCLLSMER